jgi:exopolysaccharide production protein ExoZ
MYHAFNDAGITRYPEAVLQAGVDLFFVISGFIMWVTTHRSAIGPKAFLGKRIRRIVPLYWTFTALALVIAVVAPRLGKSTSAAHAVASFLFLPAVNPVTHKAEPVLAPGWTLNHEMLFYVIFALALTLSPRPRFYAVIGVNVGLAILGWLVGGSLLVSFYTNPIILEFVFGVIVGWACTSGYALSRRVSTPLVSVSALVMIACAGVWGQTALLRVAVWGIPAAVIVLALALTENSKPVARWRSWQFMGDASYSIYIVHGVVLSALLSLMVKHLGEPKLVMIPVGAPLAIAVGLAVYRYLERPMTNYLRPRRRAPVAAGAPLVTAEVAATVDG